MLTVMRAWRHGCGPLEPWFRATPFAAAHHYRDRALPVPRTGGVPAAAARFVATLPAPARRTLWIFDLPGPLGLWVSYALRRRWGLSPALAWNGWYDPRGVLDGREEIPLLCGLARRLPRPAARGGGVILFDSRRQRAIPAGPAESAPLPDNRFLDNRYVLNEEDGPSIGQLQALAIERVLAWSWGEEAPDLRAYLDYLGGGLVVRREVVHGETVLGRQRRAHG
jgi:hypothetical protein